MTNLTALYRIDVAYYPPEGGDTWGFVELGHPPRDGWYDVWDHTPWAEKVRYARWHADVICRVAVGVCAELKEEERFSQLNCASGVVDPIRELRKDDGPAFVGFMVPDERAQQWLARTRVLVNEAIADDQDAAPPPIATPDHEQVLLTEPTTTTRKAST